MAGQPYSLVPIHPGNTSAPSRSRRSSSLPRLSYRSSSSLYSFLTTKRALCTLISISLFLLLIVVMYRSQSHKSTSSGKLRYVGALVSTVCGTKRAPDANDLPPVEYGLMIDAGSTGSRIHVYRFNHCTSRIPEVEHEVFEQIQPGLSSNASDPVAAARSLAPLLDIALQAVPNKYHSCSSIQVKATAGLRLLGHDKSDHILRETRNFIAQHYPFPLVDSEPGKKYDAVAIMDGSDEGVFAWVTINSLLDSVRKGGHTAAVMDLGGASTQIVFSPSSHNIPPEYRTVMSFGGTDHVLYQHSYLGYGLKEALKSIRMHAVTTATHGSPIEHPCYHKGYSMSVDVPEQGLSATIRGQPIPDACIKLVRDALFADIENQTKPNATVTECKYPPCAMLGVHHPDIPSEAPIFAFSYFYDLLNQVLSVAHAFPDTVPGDHHNNQDQQDENTSPVNDKYKSKLARTSTTLRELDTIQQLACMDKISIENNPGLSGHPARTILSDMVHEDPDYCVAVTYLGQLLQAYRIKETQYITVMKKIKGYEMGWCLGATMAMLDTADRVGQRCRNDVEGQIER